MSEGFNAKVAEASPLSMLMCVTKNQHKCGKQGQCFAINCVTFSSALISGNEGRTGVEKMNCEWPMWNRMNSCSAAVLGFGGSYVAVIEKLRDTHTTDGT